MHLDQLRHPTDLKSLTKAELIALAAEVRAFLIASLAQTGGHLAPNLGVVELTIALHVVYDSPIDRFVFDVGHQAYVHKLLTGRMDRFHTLRQRGGLCGFVKRSESEHDVWEAGHSSTALSAAMGLAMARDAKGQTHRIVAVVGDGALSGGMAFEALNHIGDQKKDMIVILNDNEMSIAPNVGALHHYLGKLRSNQKYVRSKSRFFSMMRRMPVVGELVVSVATKLKDSMKYFFVPGVLFEELGFTYIGPIDGHDVATLMNTLENVKRIRGPVLVHVVTTKGKGYAPAEADAHKWHGLGAYKIESGEVKKGPPMFTEVFGQALIELAERDARIVAVTPAMPGGSGLIPFAKRFPDRMADVGIAEQHAATLCAALALDGLLPIFAVYSTFLQRAYDQVVHDIARQHAHVVFAIDRAGFVGPDGETHHGVYDIAYLRHVPNMVVMMPMDEQELRHMLYTALYGINGPVAVRYPRNVTTGVDVYAPMQLLPIGSWTIIEEGTDVVVLAVGPMVAIAVQAARMLRAQGIVVRVVNARFIKPLDEHMLEDMAHEALPIITMEEGAVLGGFGSAVLEWCAQHAQAVRVHTMGIPDVFIEHATIEQQRAEVGLTVDGLIAAVRSVVPMAERIS